MAGWQNDYGAGPIPTTPLAGDASLGPIPMPIPGATAQSFELPNSYFRAQQMLNLLSPSDRYLNEALKMFFYTRPKQL